jgi:hypothetical protein
MGYSLKVKKRMKLNAIEQRIIGCLLEKEITTPDLYPLSLNALTVACNQKSNREPVMTLSEQQVLDAVTELERRHLVTIASERGSRVNKYKHRFCNTEFGSLKLSDQEKGIICVLLLRGPQTPGELRTRTHRLCEFVDVAEVEEVLNSLAKRELPLVLQLAREPGKREHRWMHCLGDIVSQDGVAVENAESHDETIDQKIAVLQQQLDELKQHIRQLEARLDSMSQ